LDEDLRKLEREATTGGPEAKAKLEAARARSEGPDQALDRRLEELEEAVEVTERNGGRVYAFPGDVGLWRSTGGFARGETDEHVTVLRFRRHMLRARQYDSDHRNEEQLSFEGQVIYEFNLSAADPDAEPIRSPNRAAAAWANRLLRDLDLPLGRQAFQRLTGELLGMPGWLCAHVFDEVPEDTAPMEDPEPPPREGPRVIPQTDRTRTIRAAIERQRREAMSAESVSAREDRALAYAEQIEGGRTSDAALDSGGAAYRSVLEEPEREAEDLLRRVERAEIDLANGDTEDAEQTLLHLEYDLNLSGPRGRVPTVDDLYPSPPSGGSSSGGSFGSGLGLEWESCDGGMGLKDILGAVAFCVIIALAVNVCIWFDV
jgi:hypothetical protein